jgi:hypothetical protein
MLAPDFADTIARDEIAIIDLARAAEVAESTIYHLIKPNSHPDRRGGMRRTTAWKLANAFARLTNREPHEAYARLIVEEPIADAAA